jgi:hypothetical protein
MEIFVVVIWFVSIVIGVSAGSKKGEGCVSFIGLLIFGPLWLPVVFISKGNRRECPSCMEMINKKASVCPHCQRLTKFNQVS